MKQRANLNRLSYFVAVADTGTMTAAAERLAVSKAVVSKQIQLLEGELGVALLVRNTRHLYLTEAGTTLYTRARSLLDEADAAFSEVASGSQAPRGTLRITAPLGFGSSLVTTAAAALTAAHPAVRVELHLSDQTFDVVEAGFDVAVHVGSLRESGHVARKISDFRELVVADPAFIARYGPVQRPADLTRLPFIENRVLPSPNHWTFVDGDGQAHEITLRGALSMDATPAIETAVRLGAGFAMFPDFSVRAALAAGELVQLLPDFHLKPAGIYLIFPSGRYRSVALDAFVAELIAQLKPA